MENEKKKYFRNELNALHSRAVIRRKRNKSYDDEDDDNDLKMRKWKTVKYQKRIKHTHTSSVRTTASFRKLKEKKSVRRKTCCRLPFCMLDVIIFLCTLHTANVTIYSIVCITNAWRTTDDAMKSYKAMLSDKRKKIVFRAHGIYSLFSSSVLSNSQPYIVGECIAHMQRMNNNE